jgi:hypothetical protein
MQKITGSISVAGHCVTISVLDQCVAMPVFDKNVISVLN